MKIQKIIMVMITLAVSALVLMASANPETAIQESAAATLSGTVVEAEAGEGIPGAEVVIEEAGESTTTDEYGTFSFSDIEEGMYNVSVSADGYSSAAEEVNVTERGATVEIKLKPES